MRAVRYHDHGGPEQLLVEDIDRPTPGSGEVLVKVRAASVNPVDTYFREGSYRPGHLPWIPGSDAAGVVTAVGDAVTDFDPGDRVFATALGNDRPGTCAEYVTVPTNRLAALPDRVDFAAAAAGALVGVTAWRALVARCDLDPGERVLVHGGSGGVGHIAVQLARAVGARVTTTARPEYHDDLDALGADDVLEYGREDLADAVREAGAPDVVLDHRLDDYLGLDCEVAAFGGRIAAIGNTDPEATFPNVPAHRGKALAVHHVSMFNTPDVARVLDRLAALMERGALVPRVAHTYDLDGVRDAQQAVLADSFLGKLVVEP
jgi:NADPH2:quinone reductase